jgi:hypothetical protein
VSQGLVEKIDRIYCCKICERIFLFQADIANHQEQLGHDGKLDFNWSDFFD